mgnify:CR=1 FL=1
MNKKQLLNKIKLVWTRQENVEKKIHKAVINIIKNLSKKDLEEVYGEELIQLNFSEEELKEYSK